MSPTPRPPVPRTSTPSSDPDTAGSIARQRLHTQGLAGPGVGSPLGVVAGLLAVQAENHPQTAFAVATRTSGATAAEVARLFDEGALLRTHVLRPTWHLVRPDDIVWLLDLTAPRIRPTYRALQREVGLDDAELDRGAEIIVGALADGAHLTRATLGTHLGEAGLPDRGRGLMVVAAHAELSGLICSGAMDGDHHTYALLADRAPHTRRLDRDEALAEIALRYLTGHGPATERDLAYWATLTLTDVRAGIAAVADQLESFDHDGRTFWAAPGTAEGPVTRRAHLLLIFDETYRGYQDTRRVLDAAGHLPPGRETAIGMALVDGQYLGPVRREVDPERVTFTVEAARAVDDDEDVALHEAAARHGHFLGLDAALHLTRGR